jgi:hypothetical protein
MWNKEPAHFESRAVPRGYCGFCQTCKKPGHIRHFPGAIPYTGCWCDYHYRLISLIHPLGSYGSLLYFAVVVAAGILWFVFGH